MKFVCVLMLTLLVIGTTLAAEEDIDINFEDFADTELSQGFDEPITDNITSYTFEDTTTKSQEEIEEAQYKREESDTGDKSLATMIKNTQKYFRKFYFDLLILVVLVAYGMNYVLGVRTNRIVATKIVMHAREFLSKHFTTMGTNATDQDALGFDIDHSHQFEYYCNGNEYAYYICISMFLKRRQDLVTMLFRNFCWAEKDRVWIEVPIKGRMPLEFLLIQNREVASAFESMEHLKQFVSPDKVPELKNTSLTLYVEHSSITKELFDSWFFEMVEELQKSIITIHMTDQMCYNNYDLCLKAQIAITTYQDYHSVILRSLELIMRLVKKIKTNFHIPQNAMKVLNGHRKSGE